MKDIVTKTIEFLKSDPTINSEVSGNIRSFVGQLSVPSKLITVRADYEESSEFGVDKARLFIDIWVNKSVANPIKTAMQLAKLVKDKLNFSGDQLTDQDLTIYGVRKVSSTFAYEDDLGETYRVTLIFEVDEQEP